MLKPFSVNKENKETLPSNKSASDSNAYLNISFGLMHTCQLSRIIWESPALLYGSPYLPDKIIFRALLCLFTFLAQKLNFSYSWYGFWGIFACIQSLTKIISGIKTMIANFDSMYSCKTSCNVQSHSHWGLEGLKLLRISLSHVISLTENEFNNHSSVQMIETIYRNSSFQFKHITTKDVQDLFENLNPRKSCSDTGLMPKLMKKVAEGIAPSEIVTGQLYGKRENSLLFTRKGTSIM